jgi:hypothetical protein
LLDGNTFSGYVRGGFVVCNFQDDNHREGSNLKRLS